MRAYFLLNILDFFTKNFPLCFGFEEILWQTCFQMDLQSLLFDRKLRRFVSRICSTADDDFENIVYD